jgi:UDP-3-O-[3-hydroxymyristoyl] glucosamine N-acyltransferase
MTTRTLIELAKACGATLEGDGGLEVRGPANLRDAASDEVSFCAHPKFSRELERTHAGAVLVPPGMTVARRDLPLLRCDNPSRAFDVIVELFARRVPRAAPGVHASAVVEEGVAIGEGVAVGPLCHVGRGARIGARTILHARVEVGEAAEVGEDCELFPGVVLYPHVRLGARCVVHAGAVVGSDGHGYEPSPRGWVKIRQSGTVIVEDDVEIGANTTIDRARFGATRIGQGTKLDNLVHVAHNVVIGAGSMIVAQVGIAGSTRLGRGVVVGGQVGIAGHIELGDGVKVGGGAGVTRSWPKGIELWGLPARPIKDALRGMAFEARGDEFVRRVRTLEQRLDRREGRDPANAGARSAATDETTEASDHEENR